VAYEKPLYLRGVQAPRRGGWNLLATAGFVLAIVVANWLVFFRAEAAPEPIRVHSGGDGPKVEVVSRRSAPRPEPEAAATPEHEEKK